MTENSLFYHKNPVFSKLTEQDKTQIQRYGEGYKTFLNACKTERDAVRYLAELAEAKGFYPYSRGDKLSPGDKVYQINRGKGLILAVIGKQPPSSGFHITAAHIDAPRIDIRTVPLYEDDGMAFFKTHYYGGIKKYQWPAIPLELRGVVSRYDAAGIHNIDVSIGGKPEDPVFVITDLLPHLAQDQMKLPMTQGIKGETMNILVGSVPSETEGKGDRVKRSVLEFLHHTFGITEEDFLSAELSAVPAFPARDVGFDRSFIGAYGHDDRVCAYPAATALFDLAEIPEKTCLCLLVDKEETGSDGVTGIQSRHFDTFVADVCRGFGVLPEECLEHSLCFSADVANAYDPNYPEVSEKRNDAKANCGLVLTKYTGARGKSGTSDASAEVMAKARYILRDVCWQTGQLGKVDQGGGGTVAMYMANRNIDTVDAGVPVLSMHAPFEVIAKADLYMAYRGFAALYQFDK